MSAVAMGYCGRACMYACGVGVLIQRDSLGTSVELPPYGRATIRTHVTAALKDSASTKIFSIPKPGPENKKSDRCNHFGGCLTLQTHAAYRAPRTLCSCVCM